MKPLILLPGLLLACFLFTGCFGLAVAHPRQKCTEQFCLGNRGVVRNRPAATPLTEAKVLELWGQPDAQRNETNAVTVWHYQGERKWTVVVPMYLIPVPLPFPSGHDYVDIYFKDGTAQKASRTVQVYSGIALLAPCEKGYMFDWETEAKSNSSP
jgi:hypothetical protein